MTSRYWSLAAGICRAARVSAAHEGALPTRPLRAALVSVAHDPRRTTQDSRLAQPRAQQLGVLRERHLGVGDLGGPLLLPFDRDPAVVAAAPERLEAVGDRHPAPPQQHPGPAAPRAAGRPSGAPGGWGR